MAGSTGPSPVLLLHSSAGRYGADLLLVAIVRGLDPARRRAICVLPERGELAPLLEQAGAEVMVHPLAVLRRRLATPAGALTLAREIACDRRVLGALACERGATIVHANTSVCLSAGAIARAAGAALVIHVREIYTGAGGSATARLWPLLRRRILRADAVLCMSEAIAAQFGPAPNVRVVVDGLTRTVAPADRNRSRAALGVAPDAFAVALVGRISDWKGQDVLARALAHPALAQIGAVGMIAGDPVPGAPDAARALDELADRLAVGERLLRLGFRDDLDEVLGAADALVVPSTRPEPFGLVALEGAAAALPVVAAAHGGVAEIVRDGETGVLVAPGDHVALAIALRALADAPERARALGAEGARDVRARFPPQRMPAQLEQIYERVERSG